MLLLTTGYQNIIVLTKFLQDFLSLFKLVYFDNDAVIIPLDIHCLFT